MNSSGDEWLALPEPWQREPYDWLEWLWGVDCWVEPARIDRDIGPEYRMAWELLP